MQYRSFSILLPMALLVAVAMADEPYRWSEAQYNKPPLTILYPEDEAISNPPFFHWQSAPGAKSYRLVLKGIGVEKIWTTTHNFYTPSEKLPSGFYAIEISATGTDGKELKSSHEFKLPKDKPGLAISMNDISFPAGTPIGFPPAEIAAIRSATGRRGALRDRLIAHAREKRPAALKNFKEPEPYTDGKYNYNQWNKNNTLCFIAEEYSLREALAYRLTGEKEFADNAKDVLLSVAGWDPAGSTGVWSNDHSAYALLHALSLGYGLLRDQWTPEQKTRIVSAIERRSRDMYGFLNPFMGKVTSVGMMNDPDNNHPWFCTAALGFGGLALMGETPEANEWVDFATQMFQGVFLPRGGSKGGWHEGIDYWSYMLYFVFQYCDALKTASGVNLYAHPWLKNTAFFKIYVHPPEGGFVPFGDCKQRRPTPFDKLVMMRLASEYNDPVAWKCVDAIPEKIDDNRLLYALQWSNRNGIEDAKTVNYPFAFEFTDIGWVVSDSDVFNPADQVLFAFRSGRFFGRRFGHSHADQNNFILAAGGDKLLWDAGYYDSYLSPHHKGYTVQSIAHNVILVGGQGQLPFTPGTDGKITEFSWNDHALHVQGDASKPIIYAGKVYQWLRTIDYTDMKDLTVHDQITLTDPDTVSWLLHSVYPILFDPKGNTIEITGDHYKIAGTFETDVPIEAILTTTFPEAPGQQGKQYNDPKENPYKNEYHLELKTVKKLETWEPTLRMHLTKLGGQ